jgi:rhodanese-related sulfurtransferase
MVTMRSRVSIGLLLGALFLAACSQGATTSAVHTPADGAASSDPTSYQVLTPAQLHDMMSSQDVYLVNVHVPYEGEIAGTDAFIPYTEIANRLSELPFDTQTVVIYCRSGNMSTEAAQDMIAAGSPPFYELGGGFYAWQNAGYPLQMNNA